ncbi:DNA-binding transcriptional regulator, LysR family [Mesorhizobium albiziae]|uniref:DNA-binding transcriptional regulator, LysR family n=1 Tax=Neomesorhizobium albiziae TaxID=335020 RepID=A0A1I4E5V8_9HYPH|nr:LysR family transcriptional regulator [Mesorhizobium albiziae]GLS32524.1 LysR family transcriptional regulator [Mesorhizobium albiziae]SFK99987.1 DNA-binding transcriptional regulator, LysR family [Mesorhizobium albiziae]
MLNEIDLSRADLNLLVLFETVIGERHVGRAAMRLNLSPSAVSHGLGRLRQLLNDPLFLRTPKGVVPTTRAMELAEPIADILVRVRNVVSTAEPFDPATSTRRFTIGAPDGVSAVVVHPLLAELERIAPRIDIGVRQILPTPSRVWLAAIADLEARGMDIVLVPSDDIPPRFEKRLIYEESFVIAMRAGHPFAADPTIERYCEMRHLVVSESGDPHGFVDEHLAKQGCTRRIALTVPNFMFALAVIAETDLISALPKRFVAMHAARFGVQSLDAPLPLPDFRLNAVAPKVAMLDAGLAWLFCMLGKPAESGQKNAAAGRQQRPLS